MQGTIVNAIGSLTFSEILVKEKSKRKLTIRAVFREKEKEEPQAVKERRVRVDKVQKRSQKELMEV